MGTEAEMLLTKNISFQPRSLTLRIACTFLEENAQIQLQAEIMGGAIPLSEDEARDCAERTFNPRLFPPVGVLRAKGEAGLVPRTRSSHTLCCKNGCDLRVQKGH